MRLQKGRTTLEGIFFSVAPDDAGLSAGSRVDAAFYLQINEFRGSRSVQLQLLDLRPASNPSGREAELLALRDAICAGGALAPRDAARALPSREQFVRVWRALERDAAGGVLREPELPLLRRIASELTGAEGFLRSAMCLAVFAERGLVSMEREDGVLTLRLTAEGKKVELDDSPIVRRLHDGLQGSGR